MSTDAFNDMILNEQARLAAKDKFIKTELKKNCTDAEVNMENKYGDFRIARAMFEGSVDSKKTIEENIKDLIMEKNLRISRAKSHAIAMGKSDKEIAAIIEGIELEYSDKITNLRFNQSVADTTSVLKQKTLNEAETSYIGSRFNNIFATSEYVSNLMSLASDYLNLGKMQQNYNFTQSQKDRLDYMG